MGIAKRLRAGRGQRDGGRDAPVMRDGTRALANDGNNEQGDDKAAKVVS